MSAQFNELNVYLSTPTSSSKLLKYSKLDHYSFRAKNCSTYSVAPTEQKELDWFVEEFWEWHYKTFVQFDITVEHQLLFIACTNAAGNITQWDLRLLSNAFCVNNIGDIPP